MTKQKKPINPKPNKVALILITALCLAMFFGGYFILRAMTPKKFRLTEELYGASEAIDIDKNDYEKLLEDKKSFVVMIDKPDCYTTANMREYMASFPEDMQFKYYRIMWSQARESSLHEKVKYVPSVAIIQNGAVVDFLDANSDEDVSKFNSAETLQSWLKEYIIFN